MTVQGFFSAKYFMPMWTVAIVWCSVCVLVNAAAGSHLTNAARHVSATREHESASQNATMSVHAHATVLDNSQVRLRFMFVNLSDQVVLLDSLDRPCRNFRREQCVAMRSADVVTGDIAHLVPGGQPGVPLDVVAPCASTVDTIAVGRLDPGHYTLVGFVIYRIHAVSGDDGKRVVFPYRVEFVVPNSGFTRSGD